MERKKFELILREGEGVRTEFKRCGGKPEADTFETICSFANHAGGNIFLGVEDDGSVRGVPENAYLDIERNITNVVNNPKVFKPSVTVEFDAFLHEGKRVIRVWVPFDAFVHHYKNVIYDRSVDSDIALTLDAQISSLYLRKQTSYTEQTIYPYIQRSDLELELLADARKKAGEKRVDHPWLEMDDETLLRSAGLYTKNYATGQEGFNLAAVLLLGKDEVLASLLPAYKTDAILRVDNVDRYDDRLLLTCNLLRAYPQLESFCKRHVKDRFYLEDGRAISPRDIIIRELISNTLMHREYSSSFPARVIITGEDIRTENGSKAIFEGPLDLSSMNPMPKNPTIARFFNNIGWADELGSGSKNLLRYTRAYAGGIPQFIEGHVFRAVVPIAEQRLTLEADPRVSSLVAEMINRKGFVTTVDVRDGLRIEHKTAQRELSKLVANGVISPVGNTRARKYVPCV